MCVPDEVYVKLKSNQVDTDQAESTDIDTSSAMDTSEPDKEDYDVMKRP